MQHQLSDFLWHFLTFQVYIWPKLKLSKYANLSNETYFFLKICLSSHNLSCFPSTWTGSHLLWAQKKDKGIVHCQLCLWQCFYSDNVQKGGAIKREKFLEEISALALKTYQTIKVSKNTWKQLMHHNRTVHCRLQVVVQVILISLSENLLGKLRKLSLYHLFCTSHAAHEHIFHNFRNKQFHKQKMRKDGTLHKITLSKKYAYAKNTLSCSRI